MLTRVQILFAEGPPKLYDVRMSRPRKKCLPEVARNLLVLVGRFHAILFSFRQHFPLKSPQDEWKEIKVRWIGSRPDEEPSRTNKTQRLC
jgi:hypothetical protein